MPDDDNRCQTLPVSDSAMSSIVIDWQCCALFLQGRNQETRNYEMVQDKIVFETLSNFLGLMNVVAPGRMIGFGSATKSMVGVAELNRGIAVAVTD